MSTTNRKLHPSAVTLWRIQRGLRLVVVGIPTATAAGIGLGMVLPAAAAVLIASVLVLSQIVLALFKRWSSIPLNRIQHVDTRQGPLERMLGLSRLLVFTAAGMSADGSIPGLASDVAESMRDELSRRGGDDGV